LDTTQQPMSLAAVLEDITRQVFGPRAKEDGNAEGTTKPSSRPKEPATRPAAAPKLKWAMCAGFDEVLFPLGGEIEMFPVSVHATGMLTPQQVVADEILGRAVAGRDRGQSLVELSFKSATFSSGAGSSGIKTGQEGPPMYLTGERGGRLIWRLLQAVPAHPPAEITPELKARIIEDLKMKAAFGLAHKRAEGLRARAASAGLEITAKNAKMQLLKTEMFARKQLVQVQLQMIMQLYNQLRRSPPADVLQEIRLRNPRYALVWSRVAQVPLPTEQLRAHLMEKAFSLAPEDVEPPYAETAPAVTMVAVPISRRIFILQRDDYRPPVISEFQDQAAAELARILTEMRQRRARDAWFNIRNIMDRVGFVMEKG